MKLSVKVVPGASRDSIAGWLGDAFKVRVKAPPEKGKANASVEKLLAEALGLTTKDVRVISGMTSARKVVEVQGMSEEDVFKRLRQES